MTSTTLQYAGCIHRGRGTPWHRIVLTDTEGTTTTATFRGATEREPDGWFYSWAWGDAKLRLIQPPRLLPWQYRIRRSRLMGRTSDGRWVGPFTIADA